MELSIDGDSHVVKILQSKVEWGLLAKCPSGWFCLRGHAPTWLQVIESNTAELTHWASENVIQDVEKALKALECGTFVRLAITDDAAANKLCEHNRRLSDLASLQYHMKCCAHKKFAVAKHLFAVTPADIRGCIHVALSYTIGGTIQSFRTVRATRTQHPNSKIPTNSTTNLT